jgi:hypothetical protein
MIKARSELDRMIHKEMDSDRINYSVSHRRKMISSCRFICIKINILKELEWKKIP